MSVALFPTDPIQRFAALMQSPDEQVKLAEATLAIAATEYPDLELVAEIGRLDGIAARLEADPSAPALYNVRALNELLFEQEKFSGNEEEYDDPRNSYLNEVLARRKGIPITLSVVYLEVARRGSLPVVGVSFPGHFLVKYLEGSSDIIIDPYHRGAILTLEDCAELLKENFGREAEMKPDYLRPSTHKQILARILSNLKGSYFRRANYAKVLTMIELALLIDGGGPQELRDRGMVYFVMKRYPQALADLRAYLGATAEDDPQTREALTAVRRILASMN